jgi:processive 1,2-diacylglycerol beta-glucosyltransferase
LTLSFGSGHVQAARAVAEEIARQSPAAEVRVMDAIANSRALFRIGYVWPYWAMVRYAPVLWKRFFAARLARMDKQTAPEWAFRYGCARVFDAIEEFAPDTIIAAEVAAGEMAAIAKRVRHTTARVINVITDYEAEPVWVKPEVESYAVANNFVRQQLIAWSAPAEKIVVCGIPTSCSFQAQHDEKQTRARYGIIDDAPLVLLMGGGMGPTRISEVAAHLCASKTRLHIIAVTGHDRRARRQLERQCVAGATNLRVLAWTKDIVALMQAAKILVTKPGGLTLNEAAVCALPVVMFNAIPGPEERNALQFAEAGAGVRAHDAAESAGAVLSLLHDESKRKAMSVNMARLARPQAAAVIARLALGTVETQLHETLQRMSA